MNSVEMAPNHLDFFTMLIEDSPLWKENELKDLALDAYLHGYSSLHGDWKVWIDKGIPIGITFTVNKAPSNHKMWLGTILIAKEHRNKGYARKILQALADKAVSRGDEAVFCGIPIEINEWSIFLGKCGFEQFKIEKDEYGRNYLVFVLPLK
ncbi:GNAT family N-acetyltransferase [Cytobacillus suaedae]|nr:GNAT family N-acetyltransferase [Cytobacillus suaedae]